ncbi:MAG TPA: hypothetical protein VJT09_03300 [Pyrinomonadaceae bacterium]|nr:hypothetical protein [Pyrinomonadaceae bacterium]
MEKQTFAVGERVDKLCDVCGTERGHVVASVTKRGQISRVSCPACGTRSSFKSSSSTTSSHADTKAGTPYDPKRTYRTGQILLHPSFGPGEVTAVIEPQKIDVLFGDRLRRLIHARL